MSAHYLAQIIDCCEQIDIPKREIFEAVPDAAQALSDPFSRFDCQVLLDVYERAAAVKDEPSIGLYIGAKFNTSVLNHTGKALPMCETFGQAISFMQRYHPLTQTFARSVLEKHDNEAQIIWNIFQPDPFKFLKATEAFFSGITSGARWLLWNTDYQILRVTFRHPCPTSPDRYEDIMQCPVLFEQERDALVFDREVIAIPMATSNPEGLREIGKTLDRMLMQVDEAEALLDRVEASIRQQLFDGAPSLEQTARDVDLSVSNLRYQLKLNHTTFRRQVDIVRKKICDFELSRGRKYYLIAQKLGFHDQAAFNRAFKKWYGTTPGKYAKRLSGL